MKAVSLCSAHALLFLACWPEKWVRNVRRTISIFRHDAGKVLRHRLFEERWLHHSSQYQHSLWQPSSQSPTPSMPYLTRPPIMSLRQQRPLNHSISQAPRSTAIRQPRPLRLHRPPATQSQQHASYRASRGCSEECLKQNGSGRNIVPVVSDQRGDTLPGGRSFVPSDPPRWSATSGTRAP